MINLLDNEESERFVLSAVIREDPDAYMVMEELISGDFHFSQHQKIFDCFISLKKSESPLTMFACCEWLKQDGSLVGVGGIHFLELLRANYANCDLSYYISQIRQMSGRRRGLHLLEKGTASLCTDKKDLAEIVDGIQGELSKIGVCTQDEGVDFEGIDADYKDGLSFEEALRLKIERNRNGEETFNGVRSYYSGLDKLIGGFEKGTSTVIGARSSSGKTTFLANLIINIFENNPEVRIGFFSLEMSKERIFDKIICTLAGVHYKSLQSGDVSNHDFSQLIEGRAILKKMKITMYDRSGYTIQGIKSAVRRKCIKQPLDIIFIDYLTLIRSSERSSNKHLEIDAISKGLQSLAKELNLPIVTLAQLNRSAAARVDKTPVMSDLRESGSIEEDADNILMLHRPACFDATKTDHTQLIVVKNRLIGELGRIEYAYDAGRYVELPAIESMLPSQAQVSNDREEEVEIGSFK